jgi:hypothetical protein
MKTQPKTYWSSGGDLLATGGRPIDEADARALRSVHLDEARAAVRAGAPHARSAALRLVAQLDEALAQARRWRQAAKGNFDDQFPAALTDRPGARRMVAREIKDLIRRGAVDARLQGS